MAEYRKTDPANRRDVFDEVEDIGLMMKEVAKFKVE